MSLDRDLSWVQGVSVIGDEVPLAELIALIVALLLVLAIAWLLVRALVQVASLPAPSTLVTALSILTLLSIAGGIATENDEAWAIAAAGIGALAGSVSALYRNGLERENDERLTRLIETQESLERMSLLEAPPPPPGKKAGLLRSLLESQRRRQVPSTLPSESMTGQDEGEDVK